VEQILYDAFGSRGNPGTFGSVTDRLCGVLFAEKWRWRRKKWRSLMNTRFACYSTKLQSLVILDFLHLLFIALALVVHSHLLCSKM
jgi:hypothetical protein